MINLPAPVVRHKPEVDVDRKRVAEGLWLWCPGCEKLHRIVTWRADGVGVWSFQGSDDRPTISPSILVTGGVDNRRCHSFVRDGRWEFLDDCTHPLAGQTVAMVPFHEWPVKP